MRIAVVTPLPPAPTGIADYAAELLAVLAERHAIDVYHDQARVDPAGLPFGVAARPARELPAAQRARPYEAVVYHMGNGRDHAFAYDLMARVPGLLVLHDLVLFHSRAAVFLDSPEVRAWRAEPGSARARAAALPVLEAWRRELVYTYPRGGERLYHVHLGCVSDLLPYAYPLFRIPVEASRAVAVHSAHAATLVEAEVAGARVVRVPMPAQAVPADPARARACRARLGFAADDIVVGTFGLTTREKRIAPLARAIALAAREDPRLRLLLVGPVADERWLGETLSRHGIASRAVVTGRVAFDELPVHMAACDLVAHLRFPTGRETSAALLRVLAQGRPAIVSDLAHQDDIPADAVQRVDLAAEDVELPRALLELASAPERRRRLGEQAAAHVRRAHGPDAVRAAWERALETTRTTPDPTPGPWPAHWRRN